MDIGNQIIEYILSGKNDHLSQFLSTLQTTPTGTPLPESLNRKYKIPNQFAAKTPLYLAVEQSRPEILKTLLAIQGLDVNNGVAWVAATGGAESSPLYRAVDLGDGEMVRALVGHPGVNVNCGDRAVLQGGMAHAKSPAFLALRQGKTDILRAILAHPGADLAFGKTEDPIYGQTDLLTAAISQKDKEAVEMILDHPNFKKMLWKEKRDSVRHLAGAIRLGVSDIVCLLIEHGAECELVGNVKGLKFPSKEMFEVFVRAKAGVLSGFWPKMWGKIPGKYLSGLKEVYLLRYHVEYLAHFPLDLMEYISKSIITLSILQQEKLNITKGILTILNV